MRVEEIITDKIIKLLESGTAPWHKEWSTDGAAPANAVSKAEYRGINVLLLAVQGHKSPYWLTYKQATEHKGHVKAGEKSTQVVFWKMLHKDDPEKQPGEISSADKDFPMLRYYNVFNLEQTEGCEFNLPSAPSLTEPERIERCERIYGAMPNRPELKHDQAVAFYSKSKDYVNIPEIGRFNKAEHYYSVMFHELTHSTGHTSRLDRPTLKDALRFGDTNYSKEELVAEMGAAMLAGHTGIEQLTIENSAAYLNHWISKLRGEPKLVIQAASQAQRAVDFILNRSN